MRIQRHWLDWDLPCLPQAARWLIDRAIGKSSLPATCDLQHAMCVLAGARAGRLLLGSLVRECRAQSIQLIPPRIYTPGSLVSSLVGDQPAASEYEMELAWVAALRAADRATIKPLLPFAPDETDALSWHSLANTIASLHDDLAGGCRTFDEVADLAERLELLGEGDRWRALAHVHGLYRRRLHAIGLRDRHEAIEQTLSLAPDRSFAASPLQELIFIAVPELNAVQRRLVAAAGDRAVALVHAPPDFAGHFDDMGCVNPHMWCDATNALNHEQIISADRPADQAQHALRTIANFNGRYSAAEIAIGLGDPSLAKTLDHAAQWAGLSMRDAAGLPLRDTPPARALCAIGAYLEDPRFVTFAALLRHADIERWVFNQTRQASAGVHDWLTLLDRYFQEFLDERFTGEWLGDEDTAKQMTTVHGAIGQLLSEFHAAGGPGNHPSKIQARRLLSDWAQPLLNVLASLYRQSNAAPLAPANALRLSACREIRDALEHMCNAAAELQPTVTPAEFITLLMEHIGKTALPQRDESDSIEMLGWLELHLDPAPSLIITGVNEGSIPASTSSDPFLPDTLREKLGLACNATRYARDAYLLQAIVHSRSSVTLIAGRRSDRGEALTPSRLLLACDDRELVKRINLLCGDQSAAVAAAPIGMTGFAATTSRFAAPALPQPLPTVESMRITDFRAYLACPYRFALSRLLRLEGFDDSARELDPLQFGSIAHDILCAFGQDGDINACEDAAQIEKFLTGELRKRMPARFGALPAAAVRVQMARLELRLRAFAALQADLCREGWRIRFCELPFGFDRHGTAGADGSQSRQRGQPSAAVIALEVPEQNPMPLRGSIDRIDCNDRTGAWRIIDYKTSESAESPHKTHTGRENCHELAPQDWRDLQLPLYHYLASSSGYNISGEIQLGYICLPKQLDNTALKLAEWTPEHLAQALDVARDVVRNIRAANFQLNRDFTGVDDFARICQTAAYLDDEPQEVEA